MTLRTLAATTALGSAGLAAGGTASPLLAADLRGSEAAAGLPLGVLVAGSALGALVIARRTARHGRGPSLSAGYALGALGAAVVVVGATAASFGIVLAGCLLLGAANASVFLTRYAAADLAEPGRRGSAIGTVLAATAIGAVAGPNLLEPSGAVARTVGLPELGGLFLLAALAFTAAAAAVRRLPRGAEAAAPARGVVAAALRGAPARTALLVLSTANLVMVAVMAVTPVHMVAEGHTLAFVGVVVSVHVAGMFGPSPLTGRLADRVGAAVVGTAGLGVLCAAGSAAALADISRDAAMVSFLVAIGVGWNAAVVGGSALLATSVPPAARALTEGVGEVAMGLAAGAGAPAAGQLIAVGDLHALGAAAAVVAGTSGVIAARRTSRPYAGARDARRIRSETAVR